MEYELGDTLRYKLNGKVMSFFYGDWSRYSHGGHKGSSDSVYVHLYNIKNKLVPPYTPKISSHWRYFNSHKMLLIEKV